VMIGPLCGRCDKRGHRSQYCPVVVSPVRATAKVPNQVDHQISIPHASQPCLYPLAHRAECRCAAAAPPRVRSRGRVIAIGDKRHPLTGVSGDGDGAQRTRCSRCKEIGHSRVACSFVGPVWQQAPKDLQPTGIVYALVYDGMVGAAKIGHTSRSVAERAGDMSSGHWLDLVCVAEMPGSPKDEKDLHARFGAYRIRANREWFRIDGDVLAWMRANSTDNQMQCRACSAHWAECTCAEARAWVTKHAKASVAAAKAQQQANEEDRRLDMELMEVSSRVRPSGRMHAAHQIQNQNISAYAAAMSRQALCGWPKQCDCSACGAFDRQAFNRRSIADSLRQS
jgi:hypothetical protein